jgi:UDP-2,3-diacylglucosamine pyrophosphatase LpxH
VKWRSLLRVLIGSVLCGALMLGCMGVVTAGEPDEAMYKEEVAWGDLDEDGDVTSTDARLALQFCVGKISESDLNTAVADVDDDGSITSTDARLILQFVVNKIDHIGPPEPEKTYRILMSSDVHYGHVYYGLTPDQRMEEYVAFINEEHQKQPFDLMIFMGDYSLDYWINGGTMLNQNISDATTFVQKWAAQLPDVPKFFLAGNHEQYGNEEWKAITGNDRSGTITLGNNTFVLLDAFAGDLNPQKDADGTYVKLDYAAVQAAVDANPGGNVWIMSHFIDYAGESAQFKTVVSQNDEVRGMFMGHRHKRDIIYAGSSYANKVIAQVGNFADSRDDGCIWGIRDLVITGKSAVSRYITAPIKKGQVDNEYSISAEVQYNEDGTTTVVTKQENIFEKLGRTGMNMQAGNYTETFVPQDLSSYQKLMFDLTFTVDVDFDNLVCTKSQFELTSSGSPDVNEWNWDMLAVMKSIGGTHKAGEKITVTLNMADLKPETKPGDQTLDLTRVTFLRWYCKELQSPLAFDIGNFRFE